MRWTPPNQLDSPANLSRRTFLANMLCASASGLSAYSLAKSLANSSSAGLSAMSNGGSREWQPAIDQGLNWLQSQQTRLGHWVHSTYPTAMTALAGLALMCSGSTATQGPYAANIRRAVDYLITKCRSNGLIGDPLRDNRYTYGHGFAMLFLSQVLGEEENLERRRELTEILQRAVDFSVNAQTETGGWGYVSAKEQSTFDEGSTTITQVQGLRGCRNAGIVVPATAIEKARNYIYECKNDDGGISYSSRTKGTSRHAITAAALAALFNAGDYDSEHIEPMWRFCREHLHELGKGSNYGHWHYTYLYYSQVVYRRSAEEWEPFRDRLYPKIVASQLDGGNWNGSNGPVYITSCCLIVLQLDHGFLPIFQR